MVRGSGQEADGSSDDYQCRGPDAPLALEGINRTPEVAFAFESQAVQTYLQNLKGYEGLEVNPDELAPHLEADGYFKWAHRIPGTQMYMSLSRGGA